MLKQVGPESNEVAKQRRYQGATLVGFVVTKKGFSEHLRVLRPIGLALDEQALAAVAQFRFATALEDGKPVAAEVNVEVVFKIF